MKFSLIFLLFIPFISSGIRAESADSIINKYINVLGGREKMGEVKDRTTYLSGTVEGTKVTITIYQKAPNLFRQDIFSKNINQVLYYDGLKGVLVSSAGATEIKGQTLKDLQLDAYLNPILDLYTKEIIVKYAGTEDINGEKAHKLELQTDSTKRWVEYYHPETGLKIRQVKKISSTTGDFEQITDFYDYREVEGIRYPFKLIQSIGEQQIEMNVKLIKVNSGIQKDFFNPERQ